MHAFLKIILTFSLLGYGLTACSPGVDEVGNDSNTSPKMVVTAEIADPTPGTPENTPTLAITTAANVSPGWACPPPASPAWGGSGSGDLAYPFMGNGGYTVQHYDIDLAVDMETDTLTGEASLSATATQPLDAFNLDFLGMEIVRLTLNDREVVFCRDEAGELTVIPAQALAKGEAFSLTVAYQGTPVFRRDDNTQFGTGWNKLAKQAFTTPGTFSFLYPANEGMASLATYRLSLTVPETYQALAIGRPEATTPGDGVVTTVWSVNRPVGGVHLLSIDRYPNTKILEGPQDLPIRLDFPDSVSEAYQAKFEFIPDLLAFYSELFGPFPYESLGINWVQYYPIQGVSAPTRIFINTHIDAIEYFLEHEITHQWLGNCITSAQVGDMWIMEGIATYAPILWDERQGEPADESIRQLYEPLPERTGAPANPSVDNPLGDIDTFYDRPAIAWHALRLRMGDEVFFTFLKSLVERYRFSVLTTQDFIALAEEVSGQDLAAFFDAWLYREAVPDLPELGLTKKAAP